MNRFKTGGMGLLAAMLASCGSETAPAASAGASEPGAGPWNADGGALAKLATACTFNSSTKTFAVTLLDGESALISTTKTGSLAVNGDNCTATATSKSVAKAITVTLKDGDAVVADGRGVRVLLDYSGGALVTSGATAPVSVALGGRPQDEVWLRTSSKPDFVNVTSAGVVSVGTSATNTKKDIALTKVGGLSLFLGAGADVVKAGDATLPISAYGSADNDTITTGSGRDLLDGGPGDDVLTGGTADDRLVGGDGDDTLDGQGGCDGYDGGSGVDTNLDDQSAAEVEGVEADFVKGREACIAGSAGALVMKTFAGVVAEFSYIPSGVFKMGSPGTDTEAYPNERPQHDVTISRPFLMARAEVTQQLWTAVIGANPSRFTSSNGYTKDNQRPVEQVTRDEAKAFLSKLDILEGVSEGTYRLPTEAEWEYAARAGTTEPRYGNLDEIAWYASNSGYVTRAVKGKRPNPW
jgi:Ca2+-binding RTX toxin-like protein